MTRTLQRETCARFTKCTDGMKMNEPGRQKRYKGRISLAVGEACKAIFWPTSDFKKRTFDSSGFSAEGTFIFASGYCSRTRQQQTPTAVPVQDSNRHRLQFPHKTATDTGYSSRTRQQQIPATVPAQDNNRYRLQFPHKTTTDTGYSSRTRQ